MDSIADKLRRNGLLICLILFACLLMLRVCYLYLADFQRFPLLKVKVSANYEHISKKKLQAVISKFLDTSFFMLSIKQLQHELLDIDWVEQANVEKIWPDTLKVSLIEKKPIAVFNGYLLNSDGSLFKQNANNVDINLPKFTGSVDQHVKLLQIYQKLSKILSKYDFSIAALRLTENQECSFILTSGVKVHAGKHEIAKRVERFCKNYKQLLTKKDSIPTRVDLRYPRAMAIQWS